MPSAELTLYLIKFMRITPAGIDITVLTMGISLLTKIPTAPRRSSMAKFFSMTGRWAGNFFKYFSSSIWPPSLPSPYKIQLPSIPATSAKSRAMPSPICPFAAQIPANGMITPAGNPGRFKYSSKTITNIKTAPYCRKYCVSACISIKKTSLMRES